MSSAICFALWSAISDSRAWRVPSRSGEDLGLLALEFLGRNDATVTKVGELGQLIRRTLRAGGILDIAAELLVLGLRVPHLVLVHLAAADDQVHQDPDHRDEQNEYEPQGFGPAGQVMAAEQVDQDGDQDPEPDHPQEDDENRPERV